MEPLLVENRQELANEFEQPKMQSKRNRPSLAAISRGVGPGRPKVTAAPIQKMWFASWRRRCQTYRDCRAFRGSRTLGESCRSATRCGYGEGINGCPS